MLGFSGADLDLGDDYLGLRAAAAHTPWLGWNVRPGGVPHVRAAEILAACGDGGDLVEGDLPRALETLGLPALSLTAHTRGSQDRLGCAVERWLRQDGCDAAVCGIAMARLLAAAGRVTAADALRSRLRTTTRRDLRQGLALDATVRASLVLGQLGIDDPRPHNAKVAGSNPAPATSRSSRLPSVDVHVWVGRTRCERVALWCGVVG